jgi:ribosomal-protein-alanine N-acetyltransferase
MRPPETFSTPRLLARKPRVSDAPAVFAAYASDPSVTRFLAWKAYTEIAPLEEFLQARVDDWEQENNRYGYLLCLPETDTPIGSIGIYLAGDKALFGYVLGRAHWGRGLMAEALRTLVDWSLAQPEIFRAWAFCDVENPASARVMEKAGMTREGVLRRWHTCPTIGPEPRDCIVCARAK